MLTSLTQSAEKLNTQSKTVNNAIITLGDTDDSGKGRKFKSRFLTPGVAGYPGQFGNVLIKKESFDKFINTMVGVPVIINHKDINKDNADDERVGVISNVWFDDKDGWYWCDGVIWDETAQSLITEKGWSVSCSYNVKLADDAGGTENNIPYDIEFLDGVFTHLAIVNNPRYERANIVFNSKTVVKNATEDAQGNLHSKNNGQFVSKGSNSFFEKWNDAPVIELKPTSWKHITDIKELRKEAKKYFHSNLQGQNLTREGLKNIRISGKSFDEFFHISADPDKLKSVPQILELIEKGKLGEFEPDQKGRTDYIRGFHPIYVNLKTSLGVRKAELLVGEDKEGNLFYQMFLDYDREKARKKRNSADNQDRLSLNNIITDIQEDFNPDINNVHNNKDQDMALIDELKKLITKVENEKPEGENMDDDKKIENEKVDKRKLIDEVAGIMKSAGADDEKIRTAIAKMEKLAYDKSEAGTADNEKEDDKPADDSKVENEETKKDEEEYKDLKKDVKEDVKNECKNSVDNAKGGYFDKMNEVYNSPTKVKKENTYISRAQKLKDAEAYFGKESFKLFSSFFPFIIVPFR